MKVSATAGYDAPQRESLFLFGVDLSGMSEKTRYLVLVGGVFFFYFIYGITQERLFTEWRQLGKPCGWFLTFSQYIFYACFMSVQRSCLEGRDAKVRRTPLEAYLKLACFSVGTVGLSNASCDYLSYPTQVLFKSSKILPVMVMGTIILKKRYLPLEYACVVMMTLGLVLLNLSNTGRGSGRSNGDTHLGFVLVLLAVTCDAIIGNYQEKVFKVHKPSASESLLYTKSIGVVLSFLVCVVTGQLTCVAYLFTHPSTLGAMFFFCLSGVIGENFVMVMVKSFGALVTVTTTSLRKALTIILSFVLFPKSVNSSYYIGISFVLVGMVLNVYVKQTIDRHKQAKNREERSPVEIV